MALSGAPAAHRTPLHAQHEEATTIKTGQYHLLYQFTMTLKEIAPSIWRRLQVPATYTFWDLHGAFQDAMGWLDYHFHVFRLRRPPKQTVIEIGIPDDEGSDDRVLPGWHVPIRAAFTEPGHTTLYLYDFGDGWEHEVVLEGILLQEQGVTYPRCLAGARACPPEDCGSGPGYDRVVDILRHPRHADYHATIGWLKEHAKHYYPYDPAAFDPGHVAFTNPKECWQRAFVEADDH